ncbi:MAG: hypothetical protein II226_09340 [Alistipes sp.]|nr:hypothetical protein [Alistipes sp.]
MYRDEFILAFLMVFFGGGLMLGLYKIISYFMRRRERMHILEKLNAEETLEYLSVDNNRNKDSKISIPPAWILRVGLVGLLVASVVLYAYNQAQNGTPMAEAYAIALSVAAAAVGFVVSFFVEYWLANRHKSEFSNAAPINKYAMIRWALTIWGIGFGIADNAYHNNFLAIVGGMVLFGAIGMVVGLIIEHYFSKNTISVSSFLIRLVFMAIGFGIALMGGFIWANSLPDDSRYQEEPVIVGAMVILASLGLFVGYMIDRKINDKK